MIKQWDVTLEGGGSIVSFTSVLDSNFKGEAKTVEQPVEEGSFATYNKVITPREMQCTLAIEGTDGEIASALETLEDLRTKAEKCQIITPYTVSPLGTLTNYDYTHKSESGLGWAVVAITLKEIKEVGAETTEGSGGSGSDSISQNQAKRPSDASSVDGGKVQAKEPQQSTLSKIFS